MNISGIDFSKHKKELQEILKRDEEIDLAIVKELEGIKAEIDDEEYSINWLVSADVEKGWNDAIEYAIGKIDNYIEELKGNE